MMMPTRWKTHRALILSIAAAIAFFLFDLRVREEYVTGVFYLAVAGVYGYATGKIRSTLFVSLLCTGLWLGDFLWGAKRPKDISLQTVHLVEINRALIVATIWATAAFAVFARRTQLLIEKHDAELTEREGRLRIALEAASLAPWDLDTQNSQLNCSPEIAGLLGLPSTQALKSVTELLQQVHPDDRGRVEAAFFATLEKHSEINVTFRVVHPDQSLHWMRATGRFLPREKQQHLLIGVLGDITTLRKAEEEARKRLTEMSHENRLTTVGQMVVELTHEISQPLYAIDNFAKACQVVLNGENNERGKDAKTWLGQIGMQARRANEIIRRLRRYVRADSPVRGPATVQEIVGSVIQLLSLDPRMKEIRVSTKFDGELPMVYVDRIQIEQVLVNLLINAAEAMAEPSPHSRNIVVSAQMSNKFVTVGVEDSGCGLAEDILDQLFQPYFTTKAEGMGMGLAISRSLIEDHGGKLWAEKNAGGGLTFFFTLSPESSLSKESSLSPEPSLSAESSKKNTVY